MQKKLYKSSNDKVLEGVCGGIGEYLDIDAVIVRLIWVLTTLVYGVGFILYIVAAIIIPKRSGDINLEKYEKHYSHHTHDSESGKRMMGMILIGLGLFFVSRRYIYWLDMEAMVAMGFIGFGIYLFMRNRGKDDEEE